jgi:hypothetical protein
MFEGKQPIDYLPTPPHLFELLLLGPVVQPGHVGKHGSLGSAQLLTPLSLRGSME